MPAAAPLTPPTPPHPRPHVARLRRPGAVALVAMLLVAVLPVAASVRAATPAAAAPPTTAPESAGLRVATFNTYLLSPAMRCLRHLVDPEAVTGPIADFWTCLDSDIVEERAETLAGELVATAANYDVLALNEVWDEDARRILAKALEPIFPRVVSKLDMPLVQTSATPIPGSDGEEFRFNFEDSGLMLFARDFLEPLPLPKIPPGGGPVYVGSGFDPFPVPASGFLPVSSVEGTFPEVAFTAYGNACAIDDCLAAKGAGLVRFHDQRNEDKVNVVFTHMQAEAPHHGERQAQLDAIQRLLDTTIDLGGAVSREQIYVMGDLNVKGEGQVSLDPTVPQGSGGEWSARFGDPGSFYASALHDSWATTTSPRDVGLTHLASQERLDYVLTNRIVPGHTAGWNWSSVDGGRCVQHVTVELSDTPSDHSMVRADTNRAWWFCNPRAAWEQPPVDQVLNWNPAVGPFDATQIQWGGGMQWFHVTDPSNAAYEIGYVDGTMPIDITIYAPEDLSTPLAPYREKEIVTAVNDRIPVVSKQYVLPPEFYVRVTSKVPMATGDISPVIHRMACDSIDEACPLDAARPQVARFPAAQPLGADDTAWFQIDVTEHPDSGGDQLIQTVVDQLDPNVFRAELVPDWDPWGGTPYPIALTPAGDGFAQDLLTAGTGRWFLRIQRGGPDGIPREARAGWTTDLVRAEVSKLTCLDETNGFAGSESGQDEINLDLEVDGIQRWGTGSSGSWWNFDCDDSADEQQLGPIVARFTTDLVARVWEIDDLSPNNASPSLSLAAQGWGITRDQVGRHVTMKWGFEGGTYQLDLDLMRRANTPVV